MLGLRTIDKTRPMEHSGKFRNIPEHSILKHPESFLNHPTHPKKSTIVKIVTKKKFLQPTIDQFASLRYILVHKLIFLKLSFMQNCCPAIKRGR